MSNISNAFKFTLTAMFILMAAAYITYFSFVQMASVRQNVCIVLTPDNTDTSHCGK